MAFRLGGLGVRSRAQNRITEEIVPSSDLSEDQHAFYLLLDLPEFKREEVKLHVDELGQITVSGERLGNNNKTIYFEQTYKPIENCDIDKITGEFDSEILYITIPKLIIAKDEAEKSNDEPDNENGDSNHDKVEGVEGKENHKEESEEIMEESCGTKDEFHKQVVEKWRGDVRGQAFKKVVMKMVWDNKEFLVTAVVAFSLGVYITHKLQSSGSAGGE